MRTAVTVAGVLFVIVCLVVSLPSRGAADLSASDESKIQIGYAISPVPLDLRHKNRALVGLGSYIVNAQINCSGCHSFPEFAPGGDAFLGEPPVFNQATYLSGGAPFFGPFVPRNLTPDSSGLPAGLTLEEFIHVLRTGEDHDALPPHVPGPGPDNDLLQVMPWPAYRQMQDRDLKAIYEYLSAIPCLEGGVVGRCG